MIRSVDERDDPVGAGTRLDPPLVLGSALGNQRDRAVVGADLVLPRTRARNVEPVLHAAMPELDVVADRAARLWPPTGGGAVEADELEPGVGVECVEGCR